MKLSNFRLPRSATALGAISASLAVFAAALPLMSSGSAAAAGKPTGGVVHFYEVVPSLSSSAANDVLTGAITDHGKDHEGVAGNGEINKLVLSKGSFEVSTAKLVSQPPPRVDTNTCSFTGVITAPVPIVRGTGRGAYAGISGTIKATITEVGILPKLKSGKCNQSQSAAPVSGISWATGSGKVSFK
jgi:hypothetical protein